jgi:hypothetical protein
MTCPLIDNPTSCEIHTVIRFLRAKNMIVEEIHRELCSVYGQNVMSERIVRQRCRMFTMRSKVFGRPYVVSDDLLQSPDQIFVEDGASQFQKFYVNFSSRLSQVLRNMGSENAYRCAQNADFFRAIPQR